MDDKTFKTLFDQNREKIFEAWNKLSDQDLDEIRGDLSRFLKKVSSIYKTPDTIILKELDAVKKNVDEGISADYAPHLDPRE